MFIYTVFLYILILLLSYINGLIWYGSLSMVLFGLALFCSPILIVFYTSQTNQDAVALMFFNILMLGAVMFLTVSAFKGIYSEENQFNRRNSIP